MNPHRRYNPLTESWVLVSPHRTQRPWQGQVEDQPPPLVPYDSDCYLCPGNVRANGESNPDYRSVFVFDNDFPALMPSATAGEELASDLFKSMPESGRCKVICYSPQHNLSLGELPVDGIRGVIDQWSAEYDELIAMYRWVQIFENRGAAVGCSNPHPHGQIWAVEHLPTEALREQRAQASYQRERQTSLLLDYAEQEIERGERVLIDNAGWLVVVPYWAAWPFETLLLPKRPVASLSALNRHEKQELAITMKTLLQAYDSVFSVPFPFTFGWHNAPRDAAEGWQLHAHFYPPLLRSATVRKFMVGYEMLSEPQRDITPEQACERLRQVLPPHD